MNLYLLLVEGLCSQRNVILEFHTAEFCYTTVLNTDTEQERGTLKVQPSKISGHCPKFFGKMPFPLIISGQRVNGDTVTVYQVGLQRNAIVATRCRILKLKCTKFDFGWCLPQTSAGAYSDLLSP